MSVANPYIKLCILRKLRPGADTSELEEQVLDWVLAGGVCINETLRLSFMLSKLQRDGVYEKPCTCPQHKTE